MVFTILQMSSKDYATFIKAKGPRFGSGADDWRTSLYGDIPVGREVHERVEDSKHPVVNVSKDDAIAFCEWLTEYELTKEERERGWQYRLPSDHEWSCAVGIGKYEDPRLSPAMKDAKIKGIHPWGRVWPPPNYSGNYADSAAKSKFRSWKVISGYTDGYATTSPVGVYSENEYNLYDLGGNVWELTNSIWKPESNSYVLRGASWFVESWENTLSSYRSITTSDRRRNVNGFRCVLELGDPS